MAIIDCVTYNGEEELFDLRYNILKDHVDEFIVCEAATTFSGNPKPLYFEKIVAKYPKIRYYVVNEDYTPKEIKLAEESPNTKGASHWKHEFLQKESIKKALTHLKDDDIVFIGDCDEIWDRDSNFEHLKKLKLRTYTYYLNNRSSEEFWGTIVAPYKEIKHKCLNHLRSDPHPYAFTEQYYGWHFTSQANDLRRKLTDSYTEETYANKWVLDNLQNNIKQNKDFLGRNFHYTLDETDWPPYLKANREKYQHLMK